MSTLEELPLSVEFAVSGMTCGACAARIQDQLNKIDGVDASVNYATETATVRTRFGIQTNELIQAVEEAGYRAALREADAPVGATEEEFAESLMALRNRLVTCAVLTAPVFFFSMFESMQFQNWQWWALVFSAPVVTWGAWPFHRAAVMNLRHRATTMDTLISIGVVAAVAWSLWALIWGDAASSYGSTSHSAVKIL